MKKFLQEFKQFAMRGSVVDLAVGVVIGSAFNAIVSSLVSDILSPILGLFGGANLDSLAIEFGNGGAIRYGAFLTAVLNFVLMALVLFLIVKAINKVREFGQKPKTEVKTTKVCPFCKSEIPLDATRCKFCTSLLDEDKH